MNLCLFFKRNCEPFLQLKTGLILLWWVLWPLFFVFCKHVSNHFYLQQYIHGKKHVSNMERKKCDTVWKHLLSCFGSSLWVLECFNHSVKTMPCNLAVQRHLHSLLTILRLECIQLVLTTKDLLNSSKTGFMKSGGFINMISKWSPCWIAHKQLTFRNTVIQHFFPLWVFLRACCKMLYHQFLHSLI